jgi:4-amino-4-deoxy-L-arabinose transferase-like glycosyltransferase
MLSIAFSFIWGMKYLYAFLGFVFLLAVAFPALYEIGEVAIYNWDEGRNAMNAYEMYHNGNYIVRTIHGQPETYETKPPMLVWLQVLGFHLFGFNEYAIRFPSVLAVFGTLGLFLFFSKRVLHTWQIGVFASLALVSAGGYMRFHVARTGDHDALLLFFLLGGLLFFFRWIHEIGNHESRITNHESRITNHESRQFFSLYF